MHIAIINEKRVNDLKETKEGYMRVCGDINSKGDIV